MRPDTCPNCGADLPHRARSCPDCGADERTGWSDEAAGDRLDLPGRDGFDYDDFVRREFGGSASRRGPSGRAATGVRWWVWLVAVLLLALFLAGWLA